MRPARRSLMVVLLALLGVGCSGVSERPVQLAEPAPSPSPEPPRVRSNIVRADYAGSAACRDCHLEVYEAWLDSPMHRMTRVARASAIVAPFDGAVFRVGDDTATMEQEGGRRFVRLASGEDVRRYRITKVIGGRYREDYVGVDVTGAADPLTAWGVEKVLPMSYILETRSWRYKGYSVMNPERPGLRVGVNWSQRCIACHNTIPALSLLYDDLLGPTAPAYQGAVSDDLLPASRTWRLDLVDPEGLKHAIADEVVHLGGARPDTAGPLSAVLVLAIKETRQRLGGGDLIEVGVGCETCHGGAAEHADDPDVLPSFELRSALLQAVAPGGADATRAQWINRSCVRCHTVLFTAYPWTWEGGRRDDPQPGGSTTNSGEARDFLLGGCANQMSCVACHDPHGEDRAERLAEIGGPAGNAICAACHPALATPDGLRAHSHHPPGPGSACVGCHLPRKNMGLGDDLVRYHRIGSPTDEARVLGDRPLECALCHQDQTVEQIVSTMERWWGRRYDRGQLRALYGDDLAVNVLASTLARGKPHEQAAAVGVLGERGTLADVPALAAQLSHEYPLVRYFTKHAIERLTGAALPIDVGRPAPEIRAEVRRWLDAR